MNRLKQHSVFEKKKSSPCSRLSLTLDCKVFSLWFVRKVNTLSDYNALLKEEDKLNGRSTKCLDHEQSGM